MTVKKAAAPRTRRASAKGKSLAAEAGEFVRRELKNIRSGKHDARQALDLSIKKAQRMGAELGRKVKTATGLGLAKRTKAKKALVTTKTRVKRATPSLKKVASNGRAATTAMAAKSGKVRSHRVSARIGQRIHSNAHRSH